MFKQVASGRDPNRIWDPSVPNDRDGLNTYASTRKGRNVVTDVADRTEGVFRSFKGLLSESAQGWVLTSTLTEMPWARPGFLYRNFGTAPADDEAAGAQPLDNRPSKWWATTPPNRSSTR